MSWVTQLARPEILALKPYEHAAWQRGFTRLHANELPWRDTDDESIEGLNRYPEPQPRDLIARLAQTYGVPADQLLLCRGSDEAIDLLVRAFCRAGQDAVISCPPTFGMYAVAAHVQGASVLTVPLLAERGFALDAQAVLDEYRPTVKLVFLCSPNNPTGNLLGADAIREIARALTGRAIVVVDHAYIEFARATADLYSPSRPPNLAFLRTLSKVHGLAGARLGTLIAHPDVIALLRKVIAPYAVPQIVIETALMVLTPLHLRTLPKRIAAIREERARMHEMLTRLPIVTDVLPSDANFILTRFKDPANALERAVSAGIHVRDARGYPELTDALRVSIGTSAENNRLLRAWA